MSVQDYLEPLPLALPTPEALSPMTFQCQACGECCSSWNLWIDEKRKHHLMQQPWVQAHLKQLGLTDAEAFQPSLEGQYLMAQTSDQYCMFLDADLKCLIHKHEGPDAKPIECQRFPFATLYEEDGSIGFDVSLACKSVAEHQVAAFQPILPEHPHQEAFLPEEADPFVPTVQVRHPHPVTAWMAPLSRMFCPQKLLRNPPESAFKNRSEAAVSWPEYLGILATLREAFLSAASTEQAPPGVWIIRDHFQQAFSAHFQPKSQPKPQLKPRTKFKTNQKSPERPAPLADPRWASVEAFEAWGDRVIPRMFLRRPYGTYSAIVIWRWAFWSVGSHYADHYADAKLFGPGVTLNLAQVVQEPLVLTAAQHRVLNGWFWQMLQRKKQFGYGHSAESLVWMVLSGYFLARWYMRALALLSGKPCQDVSDVVAAIRLVERYYTGHQPFFSQKLRNSPYVYARFRHVLSLH